MRFCSEDYPTVLIWQKFLQSSSCDFQVVMWQTGGSYWNERPPGEYVLKLLCGILQNTKAPRPQFFSWKDSQRFVVWSVSNESNESYESESILCRKQGHATCGGLTCYNVSFGGEWLKEWAKQVDQTLFIARRLDNWNGILHVSTKDGKSFWKDWMIILQLTQRFWCWNLVWETTRLAGTTTTTTTRTTATWTSLV